MNGWWWNWTSSTWYTYGFTSVLSCRSFQFNNQKWEKFGATVIRSGRTKGESNQKWENTKGDGRIRDAFCIVQTITYMPLLLNGEHIYNIIVLLLCTARVFLLFYAYKPKANIVYLYMEWTKRLALLFLTLCIYCTNNTVGWTTFLLKCFAAGWCFYCTRFSYDDDSLMLFMYSNIRGYTQQYVQAHIVTNICGYLNMQSLCTIRFTKSLRGLELWLQLLIKYYSRLMIGYRASQILLNYV